MLQSHEFLLLYLNYEKMEIKMNMNNTKINQRITKIVKFVDLDY